MYSGNLTPEPAILHSECKIARRWLTVAAPSRRKRAYELTATHRQYLGKLTAMPGFTSPAHLFRYRLLYELSPQRKAAACHA